MFCFTVASGLDNNYTFVWLSALWQNFGILMSGCQPGGGGEVVATMSWCAAFEWFIWRISKNLFTWLKCIFLFREFWNLIMRQLTHQASVQPEYSALCHSEAEKTKKLQLEKENMFSVFLSNFSINLLAFYNECRSWLGMLVTMYSVIDRVSSVEVCAC